MCFSGPREPPCPASDFDRPSRRSPGPRLEFPVEGGAARLIESTISAFGFHGSDDSEGLLAPGSLLWERKTAPRTEHDADGEGSCAYGDFRCSDSASSCSPRRCKPPLADPPAEGMGRVRRGTIATPHRSSSERTQHPVRGFDISQAQLSDLPTGARRSLGAQSRLLPAGACGRSRTCSRRVSGIRVSVSSGPPAACRTGEAGSCTAGPCPARPCRSRRRFYSSVSGF